MLGLLILSGKYFLFSGFLKHAVQISPLIVAFVGFFDSVVSVIIITIDHGEVVANHVYVHSIGRGDAN